MLDRLLVAALRCRLTGERPPTLPDGVAALAARHRVCGTLYHIGPRLGEKDAAAAERAWNLHVAGHLARIAAFSRIWPRSAPPPLVIKGADLAEHLYDDPGARAANDLDLLLPGPSYDEAAAGLPRAGRRPPPRYERFAGEAPIALGVEVDGVLIELHRRLLPPHRARLPDAALYGRGVPGRLGDRAVRWPTARDRLSIWLANAAKDALFVDLAGLLDLGLILKALGGLTRPDWVGWRRAAAAAGLGRPFDLALLRLQQSGLWPGALPAAGPVTRVMARLLPPVLGGRVEPDPVRFQALKLWLCDPARRPGVALRGAATLARRS